MAYEFGLTGNGYTPTSYDSEIDFGSFGNYGSGDYFGEDSFNFDDMFDTSFDSMDFMGSDIFGSDDSWDWLGGMDEYYADSSFFNLDNMFGVTDFSFADTFTGAVSDSLDFALDKGFMDSSDQLSFFSGSNDSLSRAAFEGFGGEEEKEGGEERIPFDKMMYERYKLAYDADKERADDTFGMTKGEKWGAAAQMGVGLLEGILGRDSAEDDREALMEKAEMEAESRKYQTDTERDLALKRLSAELEDANQTRQDKYDKTGRAASSRAALFGVQAPEVQQVRAIRPEDYLEDMDTLKQGVLRR